MSLEGFGICTVSSAHTEDHRHTVTLRAIHDQREYMPCMQYSGISVVVPCICVGC